MGDVGAVNDAHCVSRRRFIRLSTGAAVGLAVGGCVAGRERRGSRRLRLVTTLGELALPDTGVILPHEHIFLSLPLPPDPRQAQVPVEDVVEVMRPELDKALAAGVAVLVDAAPPGMGRRADIIVAVSRAAELPVVVPTGMYREPWIPEWARAASDEELRDWMVGELIGGIEAADVDAGWIKLAVSDEGVTDSERKALRAAARAGTATDATIGCHAVNGIVARDALNTLERSGYPADRFVWIHADWERDRGLHEELARRGAWVEFDTIGHARGDPVHIEMIQHMLNAGLGDRVLLSMDSGWFDPGRPDCRAGCINGYTYLLETFLPRLREAGVDEATVDRLTRENPFRAFARTR